MRVTLGSKDAPNLVVLGGGRNSTNLQDRALYAGIGSGLARILCAQALVYLPAGKWTHEEGEARSYRTQDAVQRNHRDLAQTIAQDMQEWAGAHEGGTVCMLLVSAIGEAGIIAADRFYTETGRKVSTGLIVPATVIHGREEAGDIQLASGYIAALGAMSSLHVTYSINDRHFNPVYIEHVIDKAAAYGVPTSYTDDPREHNATATAALQHPDTFVNMHLQDIRQQSYR